MEDMVHGVKVAERSGIKVWKLNADKRDFNVLIMRGSQQRTTQSGGESGACWEETKEDRKKVYLAGP